VRRSFAPLFPIDLVEKDFRYAAMAAEQTGAEAPLTRTAQAMFAKARSKGFGADNISGIAQLFD
jgi:3-hydroxyisobutyrate dehydrogenase